MAVHETFQIDQPGEDDRFIGGVQEKHALSADPGWHIKLKVRSEKSMQQVRSGATLPGVVTLVFNSRGHGVLPHLHDGHQGVDKTKDSAARPVCWPGLELSLDTDQMVKTCPECSEYRKATVGPMRARPFPDRPWSRIAPYFLHHDGKLFLPLTATQETLKSPWTPASCQRLKLFPE